MTDLIMHYVLSVLIAGVVAMTLLRMLASRIDVLAVLVVSGAALVGIWAINVFVILSMVNADFVTLMPYTVTLASKLGFGIAMVWIICRSGCGISRVYEAYASPAIGTALTTSAVNTNNYG